MKTLTNYLNESKSINKKNYLEFLKDKAFEDNLKDWYCKEFKSDSIGKELPDITFAEVVAMFFNEPEKFEEECCRDDSIVRERIFNQLAKLCKVKYDDFYNIWLKG